MVQYVSFAVRLKYRIIQLLCCHILVIAVQGKTQTRAVWFMQVQKFDDIIEHANDTILSIIGDVRSSLECVFFCSKHDKCKSVFIYKEGKMVCQLRNSVLNDMTKTVAKADARYYTRMENTEECRDCLAGWSLFEGSRYCIAASPATWFEADSNCQRMGGYLVEIESQTEDNFVGEQVRASGEDTDYWIGATDEKTDGTWVWFNSRNAMSYQNWYPGEPSYGDGGQRCASIAYGWSRTTTWDDRLASTSLSYICEC